MESGKMKLKSSQLAGSLEISVKQIKDAMELLFIKLHIEAKGNYYEK